MEEKKLSMEIYRYWNGKEHFYTNNPYEIGTDVKGVTAKYNYKCEGVGFKLYKEQEKETIPIYRYYNPTSKDHFYTTNAEEIGTVQVGMLGKHNYKMEGILGYIC